MKYKEREEKEGLLQRNPHQTVEDPGEGIAKEARGEAVSSMSYSHRVSNYEVTQQLQWPGGFQSNIAMVLGMTQY